MTKGEIKHSTSFKKGQCTNDIYFVFESKQIETEWKKEITISE